MSHHIKGHSRHQSTLFPEALDDFVTEENPVRVSLNHEPLQKRITTILPFSATSILAHKLTVEHNILRNRLFYGRSADMPINNFLHQ